MRGLYIALGVVFFYSCGCSRSTTPSVEPTGQSAQYPLLRTIDGTEVGRLVLHQLSDGNTRISITLTGLVAASQYNIVLHYATPEELGGNVQAANWGSIAGNGHLNFDWYGLPNGLRQNYQDM